MNAIIFVFLCYTVFIGAGDADLLTRVQPEFFRTFFRIRRKNAIP